MNPVDSLAGQFRSYLDWSKSHLDVLSTLVIALVKRRTVNLTQLQLPSPVRLKHPLTIEESSVSLRR